MLSFPLWNDEGGFAWTVGQRHSQPILSYPTPAALPIKIIPLKDMGLLPIQWVFSVNFPSSGTPAAKAGGCPPWAENISAPFQPPPSGEEPKISWHSCRNRRKYESMEMFRSLLQYLKENFFYNPIMWGSAAVVIWIMGAAFIKALRGKEKDKE
jgi:hypothetical protein